MQVHQGHICISYVNIVQLEATPGCLLSTSVGLASYNTHSLLLAIQKIAVHGGHFVNF